MPTSNPSHLSSRVEARQLVDHAIAPALRKLDPLIAVAKVHPGYNLCLLCRRDWSGRLRYRSDRWPYGLRSHGPGCKGAAPL